VIDPNLCYVAAGVVLVFLLGFIVGGYVTQHDEDVRKARAKAVQNERVALADDITHALAEVDRILQVAREDGEEREA
jgi:hypothetical protein